MKSKSKLTVEKKLDQHLIEADEHLKRLNGKDDRMEELLKNMGEHLSYLRKDMNIISETQKLHSNESTAFRVMVVQRLDDIVKLTSPIIEERENHKRFLNEAEKYRISLIKWAGLVLAITTIGGAILYSLRKFL